MDAGTEVRHQQELEDLFSLALERNDETGNAHSLSIQCRLDRRLIPG